MGAVLSKAGRAALRAIIPALLVLGYGLLNAHDLHAAKLQAVTGILAVATAAAAAIQSFVPQLSWRTYIAEAYAKYADAATQAFVGTFLTLLIGWFAAPDWSTWRSAVTGILVGAGTAVIRALQALLTPGEPVLDPRAEPKRKPRSALARA